MGISIVKLYNYDRVKCLINTMTSSPISSVHSSCSRGLHSSLVSYILVKTGELKSYFDTGSSRQASLELHHRTTDFVPNTRMSSMIDNGLVTSAGTSPSRRSSGSGAGTGTGSVMIVADSF